LDSDRGAPIEVLVAICNRAQVDCWSAFLPQATDGYLRGLAEYLRDNLDPRLIARIEIGDDTGMAEPNMRLPNAKPLERDGRCARSGTACAWRKLATFLRTKSSVRQDAIASVASWWPRLENSGVGQDAIECPLWVNEGNQACWQHGFDEYAISRFFSWQRRHLDDVESQGAAGVDQAVDLLAADVTANMAADLAADLDLAQSHGLVFTAYSMGIDLGYRQTGTTAEFRRQVAQASAHAASVRRHVEPVEKPPAARSFTTTSMFAAAMAACTACWKPSRTIRRAGER